MRRLAVVLEEEVELWEIVGLCHDLDYYATRADPKQHGMIAADRLRTVLPPVALEAIMAHDYRTGVVADSRLADMLKVADALAVIDARLGRSFCFRMKGNNPTYDLLRTHLEDRSYLADLLHRYATKHGLTLAFLMDLLMEAPPQ